MSYRHDSACRDGYQAGQMQKRKSAMEELIEFLKEYTDFFEEVEKKQQEKLKVLTQGELAGIEETIVMQQALDKQIENMEQRRMELFEQAGYGGRSLREVTADAKGQQRSALEEIYRRLDASIGEIKYLNQKCMKLAQTALTRMGIIPQEQIEGTSGYQQRKRYSGSILQTKV